MRENVNVILGALPLVEVALPHAAVLRLATRAGYSINKSTMAFYTGNAITAGVHYLGHA